MTLLVQEGDELKETEMLLLSFPHKAVHLLRGGLLSSVDRDLHQQFLMGLPSLQSFCCACNQEIFAGLGLCYSILTSTGNFLMCTCSYSPAEVINFSYMKRFWRHFFFCAHVVLISPQSYSWEYYSVIFLFQYVSSSYQSHCHDI